ncbi:hypothetical protein GCM10022265_16270 [Marinobacter xestospongiae]
MNKQGFRGGWFIVPLVVGGLQECALQFAGVGGAVGNNAFHRDPLTNVGGLFCRALNLVDRQRGLTTGVCPGWQLEDGQ